LLNAPKGITIELTDRCNLKCSYCPKGSGIGLAGDDIDFELFKLIVDEAIKLKAEQIALVGFGEPLLYSRLIEAIHHIKSNYSSVRTYLTTNGTLLDEQMSIAIINSGLDQMTISVNFDSRQKYSEQNGFDVFDHVVENTKAFLRLLNREGSYRKPQTRIQILAGLNSPYEIDAFREFWTPYLAPNAIIQVQPLVNWAGQVDVESNKEEFQRYPCTHLRNSWIITREGNALACCMVFPFNERNELMLGNIRISNSLRQLYFEGRIAQMRKDNMDCNHDRMPTCRMCDAYRTVPNIYIRNPLHPLVGNKWF